MKRRSTTKHPKASGAEGEELSLKIQSFGPTPEQVQALAGTVARHRAIQEYLAKTHHRLLRIDLLDPPEAPKSAKPKVPNRFRATFFDYTNNRTVFATGSLPKPTTLEVTESGLQPRPSEEEFQEAVGIVRKSPEFSDALGKQSLRPYRPMPRIWSCRWPGFKAREVVMSATSRRRTPMKGVKCVLKKWRSARLHRL
jgi:hypothetical protein